MIALPSRRCCICSFLVLLVSWSPLVGCSPARRAAVEPATQPDSPPARATPPVSLVQPASTTAKRALFANAFERVEAGRYDEARPLFQTLLESYPELQDYHLYYLAEGYRRSGDLQEADRLWERLGRDQPESLLAPRAAMGRASIARHQGDLTLAQTLLGVAMEDSGQRQNATFELAGLELAAGNSRAAYDHYMSVRRAVPGSQMGNDAKEHVRDLRVRMPDLVPRGAAMEGEIDLLVREGDPGEAIELADRALAAAPAGDRSSLLRKRAEAERGAGHFDTCLATLQLVVHEDPNSSAAPAALYRKGSLLWNIDRDVEAKAVLEEYRRRYPDDSQAPSALYALARIEQSGGNYEQAISGYRLLDTTFPDTDLAAEGRWRIGWIRYRQSRWRDAAAVFSELRRGSGRDAASARYWRARALDHAGDPQAATEIYRQILEAAPEGYYAHWSERRLGSAPLALGPVLAPTPVTEIGAPPGGTDTYHLVRARELQSSGLRRLARRELKAFERANRQNPTIASYLAGTYPAVDGYRDTVRLAQFAGRNDPSLLYPLAFWPIVTQKTSAQGPDALLVLGLMRQESMFDPVARSPADARGLMQLLPRTAERVAVHIGQPPPVGDLYDPNTNITLGVAYLRQLLANYDGDSIRALAAYNGGEGAVAKWDRQFGALDADEYVESITYRETRDYVKKVLANYRRYQQVYAPGNRP